MYYLYLDESGELGRKPGSSRYFVITILCTDRPKALAKRVKKEKGRLYGGGWPKDVEIKGTTLWGAEHIPGIPPAIAARRGEILGNIIENILAGPVKVHYSVARKDRLSDHLLVAPYGITFNYLAGTLIIRGYREHYNGPLELIVDQRSKETHSKMKFDGYVETRLLADCDHAAGLTIRHEESHVVPGLQAVDFISWGLFRYYEHNDSTFKKLIEPAVGYCDRWYPGK